MAAKGELRLSDEQRAGSDPLNHVWLSASAGTGKTMVLTARVQRLLLRGVATEAILCLTFTKAAAAEMAERVQKGLAAWVRMPEKELRKELFALGEAHLDPATLRVARTLFAKVLDAPGGLRIMTIHGFCQTLLGGFPLEAGLSPGFRAIEGREQSALQRELLAGLLTEAERSDRALFDDLGRLAQRMGEERVVGWLRATTGKLDALEALGPGLHAKVRAAAGVPLDFRPEDLAAACSDSAIDRVSLEALRTMLGEWQSTRAVQRIDAIDRWLASPPDRRAETLKQLAHAWCKQDGELQTAKGHVPKDLGYPALAARLDAWCRPIIALQSRADFADTIAAALHAARAHARAYAEAKAVRGVVDFDDMIGRTLALLGQSAMGEWVRYKLDQTTDHILVDEAQDTNAAQWAIVSALAGEYWAGAGARSDVQRTLFTVGDFKQAIFGFQGTDPLSYSAAQQHFQAEAARVGDMLRKHSLTESYRSAPAVLDAVDAVMNELGPDAIGIDRFEAHRSAIGGPGQVLLLPPVAAAGSGDGDGEEGEEDWIGETHRIVAARIARQVAEWLETHEGLAPGDVMILCRSRGELAALLVARLIKEGVPVAGVDRLRLGAPLAVQDVMAVVRFALQPGDDLNLAALLVSPLFGWSQDDLFRAAHGRGSASLWSAMPDGAAKDALRALLAAADLVTPAAFLETVLSGPLQGRRRIIARLGEEARDPLEELVNAALAFEREGVATLQNFVAWFDGGEEEVKRDPDAAGNAVRVMTVHAAKGLQAPLVILADACRDPERTPERAVDWALEGIDDLLPMFRPRNDERPLVAALDAAVRQADEGARREHWRLLYVAMTRAERMLVIAGALGRKQTSAPPDSWHARVAAALARLGAGPCAAGAWGEALCWGARTKLFTRHERSVAGPDAIARPLWLDLPPPVETRPPRPLAPSSLGEDDATDPPPHPSDAAAAERGRVLHALFERLPPLAATRRRAAGIAMFGTDATPLVDAALAVIEDPGLAEVFASDALAEVPLAGVVDGVVVAGTVDRLIVRDTRITFIDFKTGRRIPETLDAIPRAHLRQMSAYAAVLAAIYPARVIDGLLLYTEGPVLHALPLPLLDAYKPGFAATEESLARKG